MVVNTKCYAHENKSGAIKTTSNSRSTLFQHESYCLSPSAASLRSTITCAFGITEMKDLGKNEGESSSSVEAHTRRTYQQLHTGLLPAAPLTEASIVDGVLSPSETKTQFSLSCNRNGRVRFSENVQMYHIPYLKCLFTTTTEKSSSSFAESKQSYYEDSLSDEDVLSLLWYNAADFEQFKQQSRRLAKETRVRAGKSATQPIDQGYRQAQQHAHEIVAKVLQQQQTTGKKRLLTKDILPSAGSCVDTGNTVTLGDHNEYADENDLGDLTENEVGNAIFGALQNHAIPTEIMQNVLNSLLGWAQRKLTCRGLEHLISKNHYLARANAKSQVRKQVLQLSSSHEVKSRELSPVSSDEIGKSQEVSQDPFQGMYDRYWTESEAADDSSNSNCPGITACKQGFELYIARCAREVSRPSRILAYWLGMADSQFRIASFHLDSLKEEIFKQYNEGCEPFEQESERSFEERLSKTRAYSIPNLEDSTESSFLSLQSEPSESYCIKTEQIITEEAISSISYLSQINRQAGHLHLDYDQSQQRDSQSETFRKVKSIDYSHNCKRVAASPAICHSISLESMSTSSSEPLEIEIFSAAVNVISLYHDDDD